MEKWHFRDTYKKAVQEAETNPQNASNCLKIISDNITLPQTSEALKLAYCALRRIAGVYPQKEEIKEIFVSGLGNPNNDDKSREYAKKQMNDAGISPLEEEQHTIAEKTASLTDVRIGERIAKTQEHPHGFRIIEEIPPDEPSVLFLTGGITETDKEANGYLKFVDKLLTSHGIHAKLYASVYEFNDVSSFDKDLAYKVLMKEHHHKVDLPEKISKETQNPHYIETLFNKAFLNRISDGQGKRLPLLQALQKMRQMTVIAHCHGAYTFLKIEDMMQKKMEQLGYTKEERSQIQKELLCVAHAPYAPLGVSKSTMISFASAQDRTIKHYNQFEYEVRRMAKEKHLPLCYLPKERGEVFLTPSMGKKERVEHMFVGYDINADIHSENSFGSEELSKNGENMITFAGNAIINGVKNSYSNNPLPPVKNLVCGQDEHLTKIFETIEENGKTVWREIHQRNLARLHAKNNSRS